MTYHGKLSEFDSTSEDWPSYVERMEQYFAANDVGDETKKRAILLSVCGSSTYRLIRSLLAPVKPGEKSYSDIVALVTTHLNPKPSVIVQRFKFNCRVRGEVEPIADFVAALRALSEHCEFGMSLEDVLRDRLVCGINKPSIQRRLLGEGGLTFKKALELSLSMELANKGSSELQAVTKSDEQVQTVQKSRGLQCYRCGGNHLAHVCRLKNLICSQCGKRGHVARVCRSKATLNAPQRGRHDVAALDEDIPLEEPSVRTLYTLATKEAPFHVTLKLHGVPVSMEIDTGAARTVMSQQAFKSTWGKSVAPVLHDTHIKLCTYTGESLKVLGVADVTVMYKGQETKLPLVVVGQGGPNLSGRDWLRALKLDWGAIRLISANAKHSSWEQILKNHAALFKEELGTVKGVVAKVHVEATAAPSFYKYRSAPFIMKEKIEKELERLELAGIITPVQFSEWAAPIVPVVKADGSIRICGDYKLTLNRVARIETYPIPRVEELFAVLRGGEKFSKIDLSSAYQQIVLDEQSRPYTTINTHKGLFMYNRLTFGIASAPAIFQRTMETILQGCQRTCVYFDDILVTGSSNDEHLANLDSVLCKLEGAGLRLNRAKCAFMLPSVEYLGHRIDREGLHPTEEKVIAIHNAPVPTSVTVLKSFLGLLNYYSKFSPNVSSTLAPLYLLLRKKQKWVWGKEQEEAFLRAKRMLQSSALLVHYGGNKPLLLACDASSYGVGAVLSHVMSDGSEKPIAFASRSMTAAEKGYSQLDKEALAIIFGVTKFHQYVYGRIFTIVSDHKPLIYILGEKNAIPPMASARVQRWALTLSGYQYTIKYKEGITHGNADALSRLPCPCTSDAKAQQTPGELVGLIDLLNSSATTANQIRKWTDKDPTLSRVRQFLLTGWPSSNLAEEFKPYVTRKLELSVLDGCVLWGARVVIPPQGRANILQELHEVHLGMNKMKGLARGYVWWPKLDSDIEDLVRKCDVCQSSRSLPAVAPLHPWEWPQQPWSRLHLDFAGPFLGHMYLVLVDAYSKWMEVQVMKTITSSATIEKLRAIFATHGLPCKIVTDNGPSFVSQEFREFMEQNGIVHIKSAPYHPATNGLAERAVQTFKQGLRLNSIGTIETRLSSLGDRVYVYDFHNPHKWIPGIVVELTGSLSYKVRLQDGVVVRRHVNHIRSRAAVAGGELNADPVAPTATYLQPDIMDDGPTSDLSYDPAPLADSTATEEDRDAVIIPEDSDAGPQEAVNLPQEVAPVPPMTLRRSTRVRQAPDRY
ncbi:hypothetical protein EMCRGX_G032610 [Ephydatia muelleri]